MYQGFRSSKASLEQFKTLDDKINLMYWDYYSQDQENYEVKIDMRKELTDNISFAGAAWKWLGYAPHHKKTLYSSIAALQACKAKGIPNVIVTTWGDDTSEAPMYVALFGVVLYAYMTFAELWLGAAYESKDVVVIVLGTGIGGSIVFNREIVKGFNSYAGEIGFMLLNNNEENFGELATAVQMAKKYAAKKGLDSNKITGVEVFKLAKEGDKLAQEEVDQFFHYLALGIYNLNAIIDPEKIILGGGVSKMEGFQERVEAAIQALYARIYAFPYEPNIEIAHFNNDANLIGAIYTFNNA